MKYFDRWDSKGLAVEDPGLVKYVNLRPVVLPRTFGRNRGDFRKNSMTILERFMNKLQVPGHTGKRHKITSGKCCGNYQTIMRETEKAFEIIEAKTKANPVQVLIKAIENAALYEEIAAYRLGGMIARKAVITSPQRRVDVALRLINQGLNRSTFRSKKTLRGAIADELMAIANNDNRALAIRERSRIEKEAEGAR